MITTGFQPDQGTVNFRRRCFVARGAIFGGDHDYRGHVSDAQPPVRELGTVLWTAIPAECSSCGAAVNQAAACRTPYPTCPFCRAPLPCEASPERLVPPGPGTRFIAELRLLGPDEGGRKPPVFSGYRPECRISGAQIRSTITFDPPGEMVMPGETVACSLQLNQNIALSEGQPFEIVEGKHVVGRGAVRFVF